MKKHLLIVASVFFLLSGATVLSRTARVIQERLWGAIAYSTATGSYGFSYDQETQADAINIAVENCTGDDCKAVVWFHNSCGAFAKGTQGAYGWGIDTDRDEAKEKAMAACRTRGAQCHIVQSVCTSQRSGE